MQSLPQGSGQADALAQAGPSHSARGKSATLYDPSWLDRTFGNDLYPAMERLLPYRTLLVHRLHGVLPPSVFMSIKYAGTDLSAMEILFRHMSSAKPDLRLVMERFLAELPALQKDIQVATSIASSPHATCLAMLFPRPAICEGRESLIADLADALMGQSKDAQGRRFHSAILYGVGGIGKSTVALEVLRADPVVARFGKRRFFVGCEKLFTLDDLLGHLVTKLAIDTAGRETTVAIYEFATTAPAVLVLDNFEDLCPARGPANGLEDFLSTLTEGIEGTEGLNLIITTRGEPAIHLPKLKSVRVEPLDTQAAYSAFISYAKRDDAEAHLDPDLPSLLERLDGYPLAIMLLANHFSSVAGVTAQQLMRAYDARRNEYLQRGDADSRKTSLQVSADLSLSSQSMSVLGAKDLCFLLSLLPDGADDGIIESFLNRRTPRISSGPVDLVAAKRAVTGAGLSARSQYDLLRMLAPLREYISAKDDIGTELQRDARAVVREHAALLVAASDHLFDQDTAKGAARLRERLMNQLRNLSSAINEALESAEGPDLRSAVQQSAKLAKFINRTVPFVPGFLTVAITKATSSGLVQEAADCLLELGMIEYYQDDYSKAAASWQQALDACSTLNNLRGKSELLRLLGDLAVFQSDFSSARRYIEDALVLHRQVGDQEGEARTLESLGELTRMHADLPAASLHYSQALALHRELGNRVGEANALESLGTIATHQDDRLTARRYLNDAVVAYGNIGGHLGEANALESLGALALTDGDLATADIHIKRALALHRDRSNRVGEANALSLLGDLAIRQGDSSSGRSHALHALELYKSMNNVLGEANALQSLGEVALDAGDFSTALLHLDVAHALQKEVGNRLGEGKSLQLLGNLAMRKDDFSTAHLRLCEARDVYRSVGALNEEAGALEILGNLALHRRDMPSASSYFNEALRIHQAARYRSGEASTLESLADLAEEEENLDLAGSHLEAALAIHREQGDRFREMNALELLAGLAVERGNVAAARNQRGEAVAIHRELTDRSELAEALHGLGNLDLQLDDVDAAESHLDEAVRLYREMEDREGEGRALLSLGIIVLERRDFDIAEAHLDAAFQIGQDLSDDDLQADIATVRREVAKRRRKANRRYMPRVARFWNSSLRRVRLGLASWRCSARSSEDA